MTNLGTISIDGDKSANREGMLKMVSESVPDGKCANKDVRPKGDGSWQPLWAGVKAIGKLLDG